MIENEIIYKKGSYAFVSKGILLFSLIFFLRKCFHDNLFVEFVAQAILVVMIVGSLENQFAHLVTPFGSSLMIVDIGWDKI